MRNVCQTVIVYLFHYHLPAGGWFSVVALTLATFAVVTTEMLPVGLLTPVAAEFHVPQAHVSLMLTIPALVAALCSPLIILFTGRLNRRWLLMLLMAFLMAANICAATASHFLFWWPPG